LGPRLRTQMVDEAVASKMGARELVQRTFRTQIEDVFTEALRTGMYRPSAHYEIELDVTGVASCIRREVGNA
jgi:ATP-dependent Clp protease ATP-binding subunit ClpA